MGRMPKWRCLSGWGERGGDAGGVGGERVKNGHVVAEVLKAWQVKEHPGYEVSVLSMVIDGGVVGLEEKFRTLAGMEEVRTCVVMGT